MAQPILSKKPILMLNVQSTPSTNTLAPSELCNDAQALIELVFWLTHASPDRRATIEEGLMLACDAFDSHDFAAVQKVVGKRLQPYFLVCKVRHAAAACQCADHAVWFKNGRTST